MPNNKIIKVCEVISVIDNDDGKRIKARLLPDDNGRKEKDIPYAFPLIPKLIQITPKVGEAVLIITAILDSGDSERFYIGPVISQPQKRYKDDYNGNARSLFKGAMFSALKSPKTNPKTEGIYANDDDIAITSRENTDILLRDNDVFLRCGVHLTNPITHEDAEFNRKNPGYIKLNYNNYGKEGEKSSVNIVADKINILSHDSNYPFELNDKKDLISNDELEKIFKEAHQLPYGDKLVEFLKLFLKAFQTHRHPYSMLPLSPDINMRLLETYPLDSILSRSVKIN